MENMYFSPTTVGFYVSEQERPDDAVEVSPEVEAFLRECVIWGADTFNVERDAATVTYPTELLEYVTTYNAPLNILRIDRPYGFCCINAHQQDPVFFPFR